MPRAVAIAAAARQSGGPELGRVVAPLFRIGVGAALLLSGRHADEHVVSEPERRQHVVADHVAIVAPGDRLDDHRLHQMRGARVVLQPCAGGPVEREVADLGAHAGMIGPALAADIAGRKAALVRHDLMQRDIAFAARGEFGQVVADLVHEGQPAFLDQRPYRRAGQHLGLAEQQEQRVAGGRRPAALGPGIAIGAEQRELAVARQRDLRAGITALFDMLSDQPVEMFERLQREAERFGVARGQRV